MPDPLEEMSRFDPVNPEESDDDSRPGCGQPLTAVGTYEEDGVELCGECDEELGY